MADYFKIGLGDVVSAFDICQAHQQLEADYNVGGILWERPSNRRRNESTGCQLMRLRFSSPYRWVDIYPDDYYLENGERNEDYDDEDSGDAAVRQIYMKNVLKWKLPLTESEKVFMRRYWVNEWLRKNYPWVFEPGDFPGVK